MGVSDSARTRRRILDLLCGGERTAGELAEAIGVSASAIRMHLTGLQEEGLLEHRRLVRGVGKPAHLYRLTPAGEGLLSRAYLPLLDGLLTVLAPRLSGGELEALLHEVGRELASRRPPAQGDAHARLRAGVELVESLGGIVDVEASPDGVQLRGRCCPVAALAPTYPQVCGAIEQLLAAYTGLPVRECCDRAGRPSCQFDLALPADLDSPPAKPM